MVQTRPNHNNTDDDRPACKILPSHILAVPRWPYHTTKRGQDDGGYNASAIRLPARRRLIAIAHRPWRTAASATSRAGRDR